MRYPNSGYNCLPLWKIICKDKNDSGKASSFIKTTQTTSKTDYSGATALPPIGNSFMFIETSSNNNGDFTYVRLERTDIIQISNITFYYNRFSILTDDKLKSMGRFRIDLLLEDNIWQTQYTIEENTNYTESSTEWKLLNLDFTIENYGIRLVYDRIGTAHADMSFSDISITHSVY